MTVEELITELSRYERNRMVVLNGYEGGFEELKWLVPIDLKLDVYRPANYFFGSEAFSMDSYRLNAVRGSHEEVSEANQLKEECIRRVKSNRCDWGMHPDNFNFKGQIISAVVLPRRT